MSLDTDLLGRGYLPAEMPPPFTSLSFARAAPYLPDPGSEWTEPARFNLARPGGLSRVLTIPGPASHLKLARAIGASMVDLEAAFASSDLSLSIPKKDVNRAFVTSVSFGDRPNARVQRMHTARYTLISDVSEFYRSIYTHSIPWALHGKKQERARLRTRGTLRSGNRLDEAVRIGQSGQTKGIPIGPDASFVIAEAIMCRIDAELVRAHPWIAGSSIRFFDDLEVYAPTRSQAEAVLVTWQALLAQYELTPNPLKTRIIEGPPSITSPWRTQLTQYNVREDSDRKRSNDVQGLMALAFALGSDYPTDPVVSYAISRTSRLGLEQQSWSEFLSFLLPAAIMEPSSLKYVARALDLAVAADQPLPPALESTINNVAAFHSQFEHGAIVSWAIWILTTHCLAIHASTAERIVAMNDPTCLILLRHAADLGFADLSSLDLESFERRASSPESLANGDWMLAYESAASGWVSNSAVRANPFFNRLLEAGVRFFVPVGVDVRVRLPTAPGRIAYDDDYTEIATEDVFISVPEAQIDDERYK